MANFTLNWYGPGLAAALSGTVDLNSDTFYVMFTSSTHTPSKSHDYRDDVMANEVTGTNLPSGGVQIDNPTVTYNAGTTTVKVDADDETIAAVTASGIRNLHIYKRRGGLSSADELIFYGVAASDVASSGGALTVTFDTAGMATFTI